MSEIPRQGTPESVKTSEVTQPTVPEARPTDHQLNQEVSHVFGTFRKELDKADEDYAETDAFIEQAQSELSRIGNEKAVQQLQEHPEDAVFGLSELASLRDHYLELEENGDGSNVYPDFEQRRATTEKAYQEAYSRIFSDVQKPPLTMDTYKRIFTINNAFAWESADSMEPVLQEDLSESSVDTEPGKVLAEAKNLRNWMANTINSFALTDIQRAYESGDIDANEYDRRRELMVDKLKATYELDMFIEGLEQKTKDEAGMNEARAVINGEAAENSEKEENFTPVIPRGWTTLYHGTNRTNWDSDPAQEDEIEITKTLSVIDQRMKDRDAKDTANGNHYDTTSGYSNGRRPQGMSEADFQERNVPFEIRILSLDDMVHFKGQNPDLEAALSDQEKAMLSKIYQPRHPEIHRGEKLIKLGQTTENGHDVLYYVPQGMADRYFQESGMEAKKREIAGELGKVISRLEESLKYRKTRYEAEKAKNNPKAENYRILHIKPDEEMIGYLRALAEKGTTDMDEIREVVSSRTEELSQTPGGKVGIDFTQEEFDQISTEERTLTNLSRLLKIS